MLRKVELVMLMGIGELEKTKQLDLPQLIDSNSWFTKVIAWEFSWKKTACLIPMTEMVSRLMI
jgi:hypothetical protein